MASNASFCESPLWDNNLTWYTNRPDLSACFQNTAMPVCPIVILLIFAAYDVKFFSTRHYKLPLGWRNVTYNLMNVLVALVATTVLILRVKSVVEDRNRGGLSEAVGPAIELFGYVLAMMFSLLQRSYGRRISWSLTLFWFFVLLTNAIRLYSIFLNDDRIHRRMLDEASCISTVIISLVLLVVSSVADQPSDVSSLDECDCCFLENKSLFSRLSFFWFYPTLVKSRKVELGVEHLNPLCPYLQAANSAREFETADEKCNNRVSGSLLIRKPTRLLPVLLRICWGPYVFAQVCELFGVAIQFIEPYTIKWLLDMFSNDEPLWHGFIYALVMVGAQLASTVFESHQTYNNSVAGLRIYSALISIIYKKVLRLSPASRSKFTTGEITTYMTVDTEGFFEFVFFSSGLYSAPLRIVICLIILYSELGWPAFMTVAVVILLIPMNVYLGGKVEGHMMKQLELKDKRTAKISEILNGIKVLKLYAWEKPYSKIVTAIRKKELREIKLMAYLFAGSDFVFSSAPDVLAFVCFLTFALTNSAGLTAPLVFMTLSLFEVIRIPLGLLPSILSRLFQLRASLDRLCTFIDAEELDPQCVGSHFDDDETAISVKQLDVTWDRDKEKPTLAGINLNVKKGSLIGVVGTVGCGKSSLLSALLGEMYKLKGEINVTGSLGYVPQMAWIQNDTLRQNILFRNSYDVDKYEKILDACALKPDLEILPAGDLTEIGERGVNLSGGQKQRINLARAVYDDADVYLLDDPLSAVDAHVASHLFKKVIGPRGILKSKTRVLVTHHLSCLDKVDEIFVVKDGEIEMRGTYDQMVAKGLLRNLKLARQESVISVTSAKQDDEKEEKEDEDGNLIEDEEHQTGQVKWSYYWNYVRAIGPLFYVMFACRILSSVSTVGTTIWLSIWTSSNSTTTEIPLRLGVYFGLIVSSSVFNLVTMFLLFAGTVTAAERLHNDMLARVLRSPVMFFEVTPLGRILNRFSRDISDIDTSIPYSMMFVLMSISYHPLTMAIVLYLSYYLFFGIAVTVIFFYVIYKLFTACSRHLKRLESKNRSPVLSNFTETLSGCSMLRAFKASDQFITRSNERVDTHVNCYFHEINSSRWLEVWLTFACSFMMFLLAVLVVLKRHDIEAGFAGLVLTNGLDMLNFIMWDVRTMADLETKMVCVERVREYSEDIPTEASWESHDIYRPPAEWPESGHIEFRNYSTKYRPELSPCLRDVSFAVAGGERVGIVGRTGAGKSSLALGLFRIIESSNGNIIIDDIDIRDIGLHDLRTRLTIIPQDPVLFSGTIRINVDPFNEYSDDLIWRSLDMSRLKDHFDGQPEKLESEIEEGGSNLSTGQRQLVCLTRALLRKSKILVLDEATASVDAETDSVIQTTIRTHFRGCTIVTIAHRLNTVIDYDRIIVLHEGMVVENDSPNALLANNQSHFYSMAKEAGIARENSITES